LVASSLGRQPDASRREQAAETLRWLERQATPEIVAPPVALAEPYRLFVPDNVGDKIAKSWAAGREASIAEFRTEKDARPLRIAGEAVSYVFKGVDGLDTHLGPLEQMARSMTHLGWGVDMVVGEASSVVDGLVGERWIPGRRGGTFLRQPVEGTLDDLERKHEEFRLSIRFGGSAGRCALAAG
jgi:CRISPR-associated protein Csb2